MILGRREFLGSTLGAVTAAAGHRAFAFDAARVPKACFGLHSFIESNPKAVFVRRTHVARKMDGPAKVREGLQLAREIFVPLDGPGVPVSHRVVLKPNFTSVRDKNRPDEENWGTGTDPQFYEGLVLGLKEIGLKKFYFVEANSFQLWNYRGFVDINQRLGIEMNETDRRQRHFRDGWGINWSKVPDAVVYARIPHYAPVNEPDTWLLNIAKWKGHAMGLTLAAKNEQGLVVGPYVRFCSGWKMVTGVPDFMKGDISPRVEKVVNEFFERHRRMGYSRYDTTSAPLNPIDQEIWAHKTCDNQSVLRTGLAMVEGIYARDGDGFGVGNDYLTNLVFFGKNNFYVDLVALYLGGHEPGNLALYRVAKERGLTQTFNPWEVPLYEWLDGRAVRRKLTDFSRTPLKSHYLQKPGEPLFHLTNEHFDYDRYKV